MFYCVWNLLLLLSNVFVCVIRFAVVLRCVLFTLCLCCSHVCSCASIVSLCMLMSNVGECCLMLLVFNIVFLLSNVIILSVCVLNSSPF